MISPANIQLDEQGVPYSSTYQDCYYSRSNGLAESRYVFQEGNQLIERWQQYVAEHGKPYPVFIIAETGFGTGLNFLATWQMWDKTDKNIRPQILHFITIEKHPIPKKALSSILAHWTELSHFNHELLAHYPSLVAGIHRRTFANHRVILSLCFMPAQQALHELNCKVDAWYLDGFAPAKNPDLWDEQTISSIAQLSHAQTTLATFTVASLVRKQLTAVGFAVNKRKGFAKKREMLIARFTAHKTTNQQTIKPFKSLDTNKHIIEPWFSYNKLIRSPKKEVVIIGGGIAACQIAWHLAQRDWQITLLERHHDLAQEASGNLAGVISPKLTAHPSLGEDFYVSAFLYVLQQLNQFEHPNKNNTQNIHQVQWQQCGLLQLNHNDREQTRWEALQNRLFPDDFLQLLNHQQASDIANITLDYAASYFPQAAWVNPKSFCERLTQHPNIHRKYYHGVLSLENDGNHHNWQVNIKPINDKVTRINTDYVIIANGKDVKQFLQTQDLPFLPVAGQSSLAKSNRESKKLTCLLGHEGYLTPAHSATHQQHCFGASFDRQDLSLLLKDKKTEENFLQLERYLAGLNIRAEDCQNGHAAIRMATPDRFPYVGAIPNVTYYQQYYADLHQGKHWKNYPAAHYLTGLFIFAGFGSRGLTTTALCAEMLASLMNHEPLPFGTPLLKQLHPARFLIRQLKRKNTLI
ncbi:MAG: bifunctional tRNA (5-methylaminomethyl-2-thiouridine)(34)-methyltransferase MnmD/FAD-dependent 5-carboxymethylaminomethyl-2-thiouridine(34) oxidoreductase MnmC [bacterium]